MDSHESCGRMQPTYDESIPYTEKMVTLGPGRRVGLCAEPTESRGLCSTSSTPPSAVRTELKEFCDRTGARTSRTPLYSHFASEIP